MKYILLHPLDFSLIPRSVSFRGGKVFRVFFNTGHFRCICSRTCQGKGALICEAIQDAPAASVFGNNSVIMLLIEIQTGFVPAQKIDLEVSVRDFDHHLRWISAQNTAA